MNVPTKRPCPIDEDEACSAENNDPIGLSPETIASLGIYFNDVAKDEYGTLREIQHGQGPVADSQPESTGPVEYPDPDFRFLYEKAEVYENFHLVGAKTSPPWIPTPVQKGWADIAHNLAFGVRMEDHALSSGAPIDKPWNQDSFDEYIEHQHTLRANWNHGVFRAIQFTRIRNFMAENEGPVLVIAIAAVRPDIENWLKHFNRRRKDIREWIIGHDNGIPIHAHAGYVDVVETLWSSIINEVFHERNEGVRQVLFTGHSAGGALATLSFLKAMKEFGINPNSQKHFSSITFSCPPLLSTPLSHDWCTRSLKPGYVFLTILCEGEAYIRMEESYILSLVKLAKETPFDPLLYEPMLEDIVCEGETIDQGPDPKHLRWDQRLVMWV